MIHTILVTGLQGTVGRALEARLRRDALTVVGWDRTTIPIDDYHAMDAFVASVAPEVLVHLAIASSPTGRANESWRVHYVLGAAVLRRARQEQERSLAQPQLGATDGRQRGSSIRSILM